MTYGDGLANIDIGAELAFHAEHGRKATVACVRPPARFGRIVTEGTQVVSFEEKPQAEGGLINGGFFVLEPSVLELIDGHRHGVGKGADGESGGGRPAGRLGASRLLAAHGYAARQAEPECAVGQRYGALEIMGRRPRWQDSVTRLPRLRRPAWP